MMCHLNKETGDAYPEMNNLLELCKIFKCQINDLVNDSIIDIDSLDDEVLEKVVLLQKEKQKNVKALSKAIMIIARIIRIFLILGGSILSLALIVSVFAACNLEMNGNEVKLFGARLEFIEEENKVEIGIKDHKTVLADDISVPLMKDFLRKNNKYTIIGYLVVCLISFIVYLFILYKVLKYLDKLFTNIYAGDTPFTLENVHFIKSMAINMIVAIIIANIVTVVGSSLISINQNIDIEMFDLIEILFLYSLSYIFEYGYYMQKETNSVMYGKSYE